MKTVDIYFRDHLVCLLTFIYVGDTLKEIVIDNYTPYLMFRQDIFKIQFDRFLDALKILFDKKYLFEIEVKHNKISFDFVLPTPMSQGHMEINTNPNSKT
jgi:hypothetical protein